MDGRRITIILIVCSIAFIYIIRLFFLQVVNTSWSDQARALTEEEIPLYPPRGIIYDRTGKMLVTNQTVYNLMVVPKKVLPFDTTSFCSLLRIKKEDIDNLFAKAKSRGEYHRPQLLVEQISPADYAAISEQLYRFKGFYAETRTLRVYPQRVGALFLGDVGKISPEEFKRDPYYTKLEYLGKSGIEKAYELELRGEKGINYAFRDNVGNIKEHSGDKSDKPAIQGKDLVCTMDADLQAYGEKLMQNKRGCVVAIEPSTGEVLAMISAPTFDPNLLVGRIRGNNFNVLLNDLQK
ncbi:MAG: penicillin-binding protein 2, partial [Flavobacteriales bacterium]